MVLFKRRKLDYLPEPPAYNRHPNSEVWEITQTGEIFGTYETYLTRRDFYHQKLFTCEITGHSNLSFFEAFDSEAQNSREIESSFPEPLRGPVLKKVQFSTLSRLEMLVNWVYDEFKSDFWPREHVIATIDTGEKIESTVREKISFPERRRGDGTLESLPMSKYIVALDIDPSSRRDMEALVDGQNLYRDRRLFSKILMRSFLKNSLTKESWHGAPWTVKPKLAKEFNIPVDIPIHLQQSSRIAEKKAIAAQKKVNNEAEQQTFFTFLASKQRPLEVRPSQKGQKHRFIQQDISRYMAASDPHFAQYQQMQQMYPQMHQMQFGPQGQMQMMSHQFAPANRTVPAHNFHSNQFQPISAVPFDSAQINVNMVPIPTPPPPMKFPTEDLDVPPRIDAVRRPPLRFFSEETASGKLQEDSVNKGINLSSVGPLLEIWNTLNVLGEVFVLDSFVLDDLAEAMRFSSKQIECELLTELNCAVLKQLVSPTGELLAELPDFEESESEEDDEEEDDDESEDPPTPEPELRRTTRSSFAKAEAKALRLERSPSPEQKQIHRAAEMLDERPWVRRLKERDFRDGGWQAILVGVLYQLSLEPRRKEKCDRILAVLAPMDQHATDDVARSQYNVLEPNLRIDALEMIVMLAVGTQAIRSHLEKMSLEMTELRKKKIEQQRRRKDLIEELHKLDDQRKTLLQETTATQPQSQVNGEAAAVVLNEVPETNGKAESSENSEDETPRALRRGLDRKRKREEDAARKRKAKKEKAAAPKLSKAEMKLRKTIEEVEEKKSEILECEESIGDITNELRETDCQRTRCLGRDRFCNRYVWFERNGMPFAGVPDTSTAHYNYANGRLWVQGPDEMDRSGLIDRVSDEQTHYKEAFNMTVVERKELEEGPTHLENATQWAYIDDPAAVDQLMAWLDERGNREKALRKELGLWRDMIVDCMKKMREHIDETEARKTAAEEPQAGMRISTRTKNHGDLDAAKWQCLAWRNTIAANQLGMLHSDGVKKARKKGVAEAKVKVPLGKNGKPLTRQGK